jgi:lipoprotein-anchoring transpeptidase ErfK/SrfK
MPVFHSIYEKFRRGNISIVFLQYFGAVPHQREKNQQPIGPRMSVKFAPARSGFLLAACAALWISSAMGAPPPMSDGGNAAGMLDPLQRGRLPVDAIETLAPLAADLRRQVVHYPTTMDAGTVIVDTAHTYLYFVLGSGKAIRYGIGVGRAGFGWSGAQAVTRKAEWPDWTPPADMIARQPYLARWMAGGESNPLGARAIYLGTTMYRIHGTNLPATIGHHVSSGCIRMLNADVIDLYDRVDVGTRIVVLPIARPIAAAAPSALSTALAGPPRQLHAPRAH